MEGLGKFHRVNGAMLQKYASEQQNCMVGFVGKVVSLDGQLCNMQASDGAEVQVQVMPGSQYEQDSYVEVVGTAVDGKTIKEQKSVSFGRNFDMNSYNSLVELASGRLSDLF